MLYREVSMFVRRNFGKTKAIYTHLLDFRQLVGPAVTRAGRRRRGRGPGIRHRQVEHVPLALGRVRSHDPGRDPRIDLCGIKFQRPTPSTRPIGIDGPRCHRGRAQVRGRERDPHDTDQRARLYLGAGGPGLPGHSWIPGGGGGRPGAGAGRA